MPGRAFSRSFELEMAVGPLSQKVVPAFASAVGSYVQNINRDAVSASVSAVSKLVCCVALGFVATKNKKMDQTAVSSMSKLIYNIFQPALLLVNVAQTLAMAEGGLGPLLPLPIFAIIQILIGSTIGSVLCSALKLPRESRDRRELKMCTTFANSGPLPLLFADALFKNFADTTLVPRAVAYISFYLLGWSPMFWTYGFSIAAGKKESTAPALPEGASALDKIKAWWSDPNTQRIFSPPVFGCILGALVGLTPLKGLLIGKSAPLSPAFDAMRTLGAAYLPAAILVLAGSLAGKSSDDGTAGESTSLVRNVSMVMLARFVMMPIAALALVKSGISLNMLPNDKMLYFILLMEACMPSAQNSVIMLQMEGQTAAAQSMAKTLSTVYLLSIIPMALLLTACLQWVAL